MGIRTENCDNAGAAHHTMDFFDDMTGLAESFDGPLFHFGKIRFIRAIVQTQPAEETARMAHAPDVECHQSRRLALSRWLALGKDCIDKIVG
jgi:hypothetical protein